MVEIDNVFQCWTWNLIIALQKGLKLFSHIFGGRGLISTHFIRQLFILPYPEPLLTFIRRAGFQNTMQTLDKCFGEFSLCIGDNKIDSLKVIRSLNYVINIDGLVGNSYGVSLKNKTSLIVG